MIGPHEIQKSAFFIEIENLDDLTKKIINDLGKLDWGGPDPAHVVHNDNV